MISQSTKNIVASLVSIAVSGGSAIASQPTAQIDSKTGKVMLNSGHGFLQPDLNAQLFAGDRVLVGKNSSMTLMFLTANCSVTYAEASVVVVPAKAPCEVGEHIAAADLNFAIPANWSPAAPVYSTFAGTNFPVVVGLGFSLTVFGLAGATQLFPLSAP